jgi:hypothetical protein
MLKFILVSKILNLNFLYLNTILISFKLHLFLECWDGEPGNRPSIYQVVDWLNALITKSDVLIENHQISNKQEVASLSVNNSELQGDLSQLIRNFDQMNSKEIDSTATSSKQENLPTEKDFNMIVDEVNEFNPLMKTNFNDQDLLDTDRESRITSGKEKSHIKFSDPHIYSSDEDIYHRNNNINSNGENGEKKGKKKKKRSSKKSKTRADGHFPVSDEISTKISLVGPSSSYQLERVINEQNLEEAKTLFTQHEEDEENIKQPSSTKSESYINQMIPTQDSSQQQDSFQQQNVIALTRMLPQIQADIAVKEQLVSQLERAEQEYTYMRAQYEQKLYDMQEALVTLQEEKVSAVKRAKNASTGVSTRDKNSILTGRRIPWR